MASVCPISPTLSRYKAGDLQHSVAYQDSKRQFCSRKMETYFGILQGWPRIQKGHVLHYLDSIIHSCFPDLRQFNDRIYAVQQGLC